MTVLYINVVNGLNSDGFNVRIMDNENELFKESYRYGYNASYDKRNADYSHRQYLKAKENEWTSWYYCEKPFVTDIIKELANTYKVQDINVFKGVHIFSGEDYTQEELDKWEQTYLLDL